MFKNWLSYGTAALMLGCGTLTVRAEETRKGVAQYRAAAEKGDAEAQAQLGMCYYFGDGVTQNYAEAAKYLELAARQGHVNAQSVLGVCYLKGEGVQPDVKKALYWLHKAAAQGYASAQCELGLCYLKGNVIPQDHRKAVYWYRKAAEQGYAEAPSVLGMCYLNGWGVEKDLEKAIYWYRKAAEKNDEQAKKVLKILLDVQAEEQRELKLEKEAEEFRKSMTFSDPKKAEAWKKSREKVQAFRYESYKKAAAKNGGRILRAINPSECTYYSTEGVCELPRVLIEPYPKIAHVNTVLNFKFPKKLGSSTAESILTYPTKASGYSIKYLDLKTNISATIYVYDMPISLLKNEGILAEELRHVAAEINQCHPNASIGKSILSGNFRDGEKTQFLYFSAQFDSNEFNKEHTFIRCRSYTILFSKNQKFVKIRITQGGGDAKTMDDFVAGFLADFERKVIRDSQTRKRKFEKEVIYPIIDPSELF